MQFVDPLETRVTTHVAPATEPPERCDVLLHPGRVDAAGDPAPADVDHCQDVAVVTVDQMIQGFVEDRFHTFRRGTANYCRAHALFLLGEERLNSALAAARAALAADTRTAAPTAPAAPAPAVPAAA